MKSLYIKLWPDILTDPKMGRLTNGAFRRCILLFLLCNDNDNRDGTLPTVEDIAWILHIDESTLIHELDELFTAGIVTWPEPGRPFIVNYKKRQGAATARERKQISRALAASKEAGHEPVTNRSRTGHEPVTRSAVSEGNVSEGNVISNVREDDPALFFLQEKDNSLTHSKAAMTEWGFGPALDKYWPVIEALQIYCSTPKKATFTENIYTIIGWGKDGPRPDDIKPLVDELRQKPNYDGIVWVTNTLNLFDAKKREAAATDADAATVEDLQQMDADAMAEITRHGMEVSRNE